MNSPAAASAVAIALLCVVSCLLASAGCQETKPSKQLPTTPMQIGSERFTLEIANTDAARTRGLMKRDSMPDDHGMIFVFGDESTRSFWMRDTRIPLDILYVDAGGKVVSIHAMKPYVLTATRSAGPAKYAIELNQGAAARAGVKVGDVLAIPPEAKEPAS